MADCTCNNFPANLGNVTFGANVGIGVTPAAWDSAFTGLQVGGTGTISAHSAAAAAGHAFNIMQNAYYGLGGSPPSVDFHYLAADAASRVMLGGGAFQVFTAPSGGVGAVIPWTERVRVANDGKVGIGTTNPSEKLEVNGNVKVAGKVISATAGGNGSLLRDVDNDYLSLSGGKTRRGPTSGGLIQLMGNARALNPGSIQYILGEGAASPKHIFYDNGPDATIQEIASIDNSGNASFNGNVTAANSLKVWESLWFDVAALGTYPVSHNLGTLPKFIQAFFRQSLSSPHFMVLEGFRWGELATEYGAYIRAITTTSMELIVRHKIGLNDAGDTWLTSGQVKLCAWA